MKNLFRLSTLLAVGLAIGACSSTQKTPQKSPEEQLVDVRVQQRTLVDRLYQTYGGSEVAGGGSGGVLGHAVSEADRGYFERSCLAVGRGERPVSLSPKLQEYLGRAEVAKDCRSAADLQRQIDALSKQIAGK